MNCVQRGMVYKPPIQGEVKKKDRILYPYFVAMEVHGPRCCMKYNIPVRSNMFEN